MPTTMILRFRDLATKEGDTVRLHLEIIDRLGYVWWGWWNKPYENIPRQTFAKFRDHIKRRGYINIFLADSGRELLYRARLVDIWESDTSNAISSKEPEKTPEYYRTRPYKAWFRFTSIEKVGQEKLRNFSYDEISPEEYLKDPSSYAFHYKRIFNIQEMLNRHHRTIYFAQPYDSNKHKDHCIELMVPKHPAHFMEEPIFRNSNYILHISDIHFGKKSHNFPTKANDVHSTLASLIVADLRSKYKEEPPAAIIISGDLTWQGREEEFNNMFDFIQQFKSELELDPYYHFVIVPGNHDIQWAAQRGYKYDRTKLVTRSSKVAEKNYSSFFKRTFGLSPNKFLSMGRRYILRNYVAVDIAGLNSSLLENRHFAGFGFVKLEQLEHVADAMSWTNSESGLKNRMIIMHHHVVPVKPSEKITNYEHISFSLTLDAGQIIYRAIELGIDLIAHGHMHQPFASIISRLIKENGTRYRPGRLLGIHGAGSAGAKSDIGRNSYSIYVFDEKSLKISIRSMGQDVNRFEEGWSFQFQRTDRGLLLTSEVI